MNIDKLNLQKGSILINKSGSSELNIIKDLTDLSAVLQRCNESFEAIGTETFIFPLNRLSIEYLVYSPPATLAPPKIVTKNDLELGMELVKVFLTEGNPEIRAVTYIGEDFYLYKNVTSTEKKIEHRREYSSLSQFTKLNKNNIEKPRFELEISRYNESVFLCGKAIRGIIDSFEKLAEARNQYLKQRLIEAISNDSFSEKVRFCLANSVPVKLSGEQQTHLKHYGVNVCVTKQDIIPRGFGFGFDDEDDEIIVEYYSVRYFDHKNLSDTLESMIFEEMDKKKNSQRKKTR